MLGSSLGKHAVVSFNNLWNILLDRPNVDWLSQQEKKKSWVEKVDTGKEREKKDLGGTVNV